MEKIAAGITHAAAKLGNDEASLDLRRPRHDDHRHAAQDLAAARSRIGGRTMHVAGMAKGAAMIGPNMATMLALVLTDAALTPDDAQAMLTRRRRTSSFNCISVDGHMSTNDTVLLLANGAACGRRRWPATTWPSSTRRRCARSATDLAKQIAADGEGATHLITIDVTGCASRADAHRIAKTIADSPLVKTAIAGADPNWGRIVSAAGYAGPRFDPRGVSTEAQRHAALRARRPGRRSTPRPCRSRSAPTATRTSSCRSPRGAARCGSGRPISRPNTCGSTRTTRPECRRHDINADRTT